MKRTTLENAINNGCTVVYLATYNGRGAFEPYTIGDKHPDGLCYRLINAYGRQWWHYWDQEVYIPKAE